jgi:hypothetical protein
MVPWDSRARRIAEMRLASEERLEITSGWMWSGLSRAEMEAAVWSRALEGTMLEMEVYCRVKGR